MSSGPHPQPPRERPDSRPIPREEGLSRRSAAFLLAGIVLVGLTLRLAYYHDIAQDPLYRYPVLDEGHYYEVAHQMATGQSLAAPYWRPPGLYFILAGTIRLFGPGPDGLRLLQVIVSSLVAWLTYRLARRFQPRPIALLAAGLVTLNGVLIATTIEIKDTNWTLLFDLLALIFLVETHRRGSAWPALLAGLSIGVSALFRPIILAFLPVAALWLALGGRSQKAGASLPRRLVLPVLVVLGAALPIVPVAWWNNQGATGAGVRKPFVLICTNGGMNFFIGNNANYQATVLARPGNQWDSAVLEPARSEGYLWENAERERFYYNAAIDYLRKNPGPGLGLWLRKLYLFFNGHEIPRDTDIYVDSEDSPILAALVWNRWPWVPLGLVIPLAVVGFLLTRRERPGYGILGLFLAVQAVSVAAFFVSSRYRVPSIPALSILAAAGIVAIVGRLRNRHTLSAWAPALAACALTIGLNLSTAETRQSLRAERYYFRANALDRSGRHDEALRTYVVSSRLDTTDVRPLLALGARLESKGDLDGAVGAWRRVNQIGPYSARDRDHLVSLYMKQNRYKEAIGALRADLSMTGHLPSRHAATWFRLGILYYQLARFDDGLAALTSSHSMDADMWLKSVVAWSHTAERFDGNPALNEAEGDFWLDVARLASAGGGGKASTPVWRRAERFQNPGARVEIAAHLEAEGSGEGGE